MIYFILADFYAKRPDGSSYILSERSQALENRGYKVTWVCHKDYFSLDWFDYNPKFMSWADFLKISDHENNLYITSWDFLLEHIYKEGFPPERMIFYAQSQFDSAPEFTVNSITVSGIAKNNLSKMMGWEPEYVINDGVNYQKLKNYRKIDNKKNEMCLIPPTRDNYLLYFAANLLKPIKVCVLKYKTQNEFYKVVSEFKYYLNMYVFEGFGLPPLEAMGLGTVPIILFKHGSLAYANKNNCIGLNDNLREAANQLKNITDKEYKELQLVGLKTAEEWDIKNSNRNFIDLIRKLL